MDCRCLCGTSPFVLSKEILLYLTAVDAVFASWYRQRLSFWFDAIRSGTTFACGGLLPQACGVLYALKPRKWVHYLSLAGPLCRMSMAFNLPFPSLAQCVPSCQKQWTGCIALCILFSRALSFLLWAMTTCELTFEIIDVFEYFTSPHGDMARMLRCSVFSWQCLWSVRISSVPISSYAPASCCFVCGRSKPYYLSLLYRLNTVLYYLYIINWPPYTCSSNQLTLVLPSSSQCLLGVLKKLRLLLPHLLIQFGLPGRSNIILFLFSRSRQCSRLDVFTGNYLRRLQLVRKTASSQRICEFMCLCVFSTWDWSYAIHIVRLCPSLVRYHRGLRRPAVVIHWAIQMSMFGSAY